ncbi:hypothetical protein [Hymenobacter glacieicola]|uniref:Phage protein n=1 Tax=Hymenobacter glacieicola TaxID=1562124 RepID=A0ABQ1X8I0_9BACT|nr:hypothetical protein [Hymenobacter glacieicola]GGG61214.1 hypothetical protein GCM10011378_41520 [Hymenobacter glacieicola]
MNWIKIDLGYDKPYELNMELPPADNYSVATQAVLICYTVKDQIGMIRRKYDIGWFDHDGDKWYCTLQYNNKDQVHEYLAYAEFERYRG